MMKLKNSHILPGISLAMEVTTGALLAKHSDKGDRVVILHLSLGERGNPLMPPEEYAEQKRKEANEAAEFLVQR